MPKFNKKASKRIRNYKKKPILFALLLIFIVFLLIINLSDLISGVLTQSGSLFIKNKIDVASYSVYAVSIADFNNLEEAEETSYQTKKMGGAGFIYKNGEYFVLVSSYQTLAEAQEIQQNLLDLGYNSKIINIKCESISKFYKGKNLQNFKEILLYLKQVYIDLNENNIKLDKNEIDFSKMNSLIAKSITKLINSLKLMQSFASNFDKELTQIISSNFDQAIKKLNSIFSDGKNDIIFTSKIKDCCINLALINSKMNNELNDL